MKYHTNLDYRKRKRFIFRLKFTIFLIFVGIVAAGGYGFYTLFTDQVSNSSATSTSQVRSSYVASSGKVMQSPYFQFQANKYWAEIKQESTPNKFVYRSIRSKLIEHEIVVYVDQIPSKLEANRVLPVTIKNNNGLELGSVSDHCVKAAGGSRIDSPEVAINNARFKCDADSTNYTVLLSQIGGNSTLRLKRTDGSTANYTIYYTNLKATPDPNEVSEVLSTFQAR
jgi:hypothetical protein